MAEKRTDGRTDGRTEHEACHVTPTWKVLVGDVREQLARLPDASVQCCVTSPPYWGLRDYGVADQVGLEKTPALYVGALVDVFRDVRRALRNDGVFWLNIGDCFLNAKGQAGGIDPKNPARRHLRGARPNDVAVKGLKRKDLVGIPWMLAFALRADGWYLRRDVIWSKPNPTPESMTDRPASSHEYIFLLTKRVRYFYDANAVKEPYAESTLREARSTYTGTGRKDYLAARAQDPSATKARIVESLRRRRGMVEGTAKKQGLYPDRRVQGFNERYDADPNLGDGRHCRSVWTFPTQPYREAHFATFPEALPERCIKAGSRLGDVVLDPFCGSGTTGQVAIQLGRSFIGIELNPAYAKLARKRISGAAPLFSTEALA